MNIRGLSVCSIDILNAMAERGADSQDSICAYWLTVEENRTKLLGQICEEFEERAIVPMAIRDSGLFLNANVVMQDLVHLIAQHQDDVLRPNKLAAIKKERTVVFLLLSREPLRIPQTASPVHFPEWFPLVGGLEIAVRIIDLSWSINIPIKSNELEIDILRSLLFDADCSLCSRIKRTLESSPNKVDSFFSRFFPEGCVDRASWIEKCEDLLAKVEDPMGYRPTLKNSHSVVSRLWRAWATTAPDSMGRHADALRSASSVKNYGNVRRGLVYLITRPTSPVTDIERQIFVAIINVISAGCQLSNAAAHSSDYDRVNGLALRGISVEIQESLRSFCGLLD